MTNTERDEQIARLNKGNFIIGSGSFIRLINDLDVENKRLTKLTDTQAIRIEGYKEENKRLREALEEIANGDGYYGAQAFEYKQIAKQALEGSVVHSFIEYIIDGKPYDYICEGWCYDTIEPHLERLQRRDVEYKNKVAVVKYWLTSRGWVCQPICGIVKGN